MFYLRATLKEYHKRACNKNLILIYQIVFEQLSTYQFSQRVLDDFFIAYVYFIFNCMCQIYISLKKYKFILNFHIVNQIKIFDSYTQF